MSMNRRSEKTALLLLGVMMVFGGLDAAEGGQLRDLSYTSTADGKAQVALVLVPGGYDPNVPTPLLVGVTGMYRDAPWGMKYLRSTGERHGWLVVAMNMQGERTGPGRPGVTQPAEEWNPAAINLGAPRALQDVMDALNAAINHYCIDTSRVYLVGVSMGGLTGGLVLQNHRERFAAGALLMGISDLTDWYHEWTGVEPDFIGRDIVVECGGTPDEMPAEYAQRSLLPKAEVLAGLPVMIVHGRSDNTVRASHAEKLIAAIHKHHPTDLYIYWFEGGHQQDMIDLNKVFNFLEQFRKTPCDKALRQSNN